MARLVPVKLYGLNFSCVDLLREIQLRVKPAYHLFGHIHEGKVGIKNSVQRNDLWIANNNRFTARIFFKKSLSRKAIWNTLSLILFPYKYHSPRSGRYNRRTDDIPEWLHVHPAIQSGAISVSIWPGQEIRWNGIGVSSCRVGSQGPQRRGRRECYF